MGWSFHFTSHVRDAIQEAQKAKNIALEIMGGVAETHAKEYSPVDTGRLKGSITHRQKSEDTEIIGTNVEYAPYQEFGTYKMAAHPFMRPAIENHVAEYVKIAKQVFSGKGQNRQTTNTTELHTIK